MTDRLLAPLAMRSVLATGAGHGRARRVLHAAISGLWLGVLSEQQLTALDEHYYETDPTYRTDGWNARGLWDWERETVTSAVPPGGRVVVAACGGGREVLGLLRAGYDAVGFESHPVLSAFGQAFLAERGHPGRVRQAERDRFPRIGPADAVLIGWGALSLIAPRERRTAFLRDAAGCAPDGPVIMSVFTRSRIDRSLRLTAGLADPLRRLRRSNGVEVGDTLAPNRVHVFTREDVERELDEAGLVITAWSVVGAANEVTEYACAVARSR